MSDDARFEDAQDQPLRLVATDPTDLEVIAALVQDAVLPAAEMSWRPKERRFALLLNRFRWEDRAAADLGKRTYERVQSILVIDEVEAVASQGIDPKDKETVLSLLTLGFGPTDSPAGTLELSFAGDGAVRLTVECLSVTIKDVTRPYAAVSGHAPQHSDG